MAEKCRVFAPILHPEMVPEAPGLLRDGADHLADRKFGEGRWRRVSFEAAEFDPWPLTHWEVVARFWQTEVDAVPEEARMWVANASYEEVPDDVSSRHETPADPAPATPS